MRSRWSPTALPVVTGHVLTSSDSGEGKSANASVALPRLWRGVISPAMRFGNITRLLHPPPNCDLCTEIADHPTSGSYIRRRLCHDGAAARGAATARGEAWSTGSTRCVCLAVDEVHDLARQIAVKLLDLGWPRKRRRHRRHGLRSACAVRMGWSQTPGPSPISPFHKWPMSVGEGRVACSGCPEQGRNGARAFWGNTLAMVLSSQPVILWLESL